MRVLVHLHPQPKEEVMELEQIKQRILVQIDKDLPLGEMELAVEDVGRFINARLTELCLHGTVEEDKPDTEPYHTESFTHNWSPGVKPRGKLEVFLWLLPKWLRWRKLRFERIELATHVVNHQFYRKRTTYIPRPDIRSPQPRVDIDFSGFEARLMQSMATMSGDFPAPFMPMSSIPIQTNPFMEDGAVLIMNPNTMSMLRKKIGDF